MKVIKFTHEDGETWALPLMFVAEHRAKYYAKNDEDTTFEKEVEFVMGDNWEGIDWLRNNMNPSDFEPSMFQISKPNNVSFMEKFNNGENGETNIVEHE